MNQGIKTNQGDKIGLTAFEKRLKRRVTGRAHPFFAVCPPGLTAFCKNEILSHGFDQEKLAVTQGGVEFKCKPDTCMELNLKLGSPSRILMRISQFKADAFNKFEKKMAAIEWELFLPGHCSPKFKVTTKKSALYHSDAIAQRSDAILRQRLGAMEPGKSIPPNKNGLQTIFIRADHDNFTISLDCSGDLLFKRGIKKQVGQAPLRETLAFAMLHWANFTDKDILIDPMCGSGTFSLEGAMVKAHMPPGFSRSFAFEAWPGFSNKTLTWQKNQIKTQIKYQIREQHDQNNTPRIFASDIDEEALDALNQNSSAPPFDQLIDVSRKDFFNLLPDTNLKGKKGVLMLNPPYGKRLGKKQNTAYFYREIGKKLDSDFKGWRVGIIFPDRKTLSNCGLRLEPHPIFHGGLDIFAGVGII